MYTPISPFSQTANVLLQSQPGLSSPESFTLLAPQLPKNASGYAVPVIPVQTNEKGDYSVSQAPNFDTTLPGRLSVVG